MAPDLSPSLAAAFLVEARALVDAELERRLPPADQGAPRLAEAMRYSVFAGGKRLRPALAIAASRAVGGNDADVLPFACALEMVHTYSLIHDDLPAMDDDDLRRGRPTSHKVFGEALAILAGDALHTEAFSTLFQSSLPVPRIAVSVALLARAIGFHGMVGGQIEDLASDGQTPELDRLQRIQIHKTGALLIASLQGGAVAAGVFDGNTNQPLLEGLMRFGECLGLAFQITDDVLDEVGTEAQLGKTPGKDRAAGKMTFVALDGVDGARARAAALRDAALAELEALRDHRGFDGTLLASLARYVVDRSN